MTLKREQRVLVDNLLISLDETLARVQRRHATSWFPELILENGFKRIRSIMSGKYPGNELKEHAIEISQIIGREVRRARAFVDLTAEEVIQALDAAERILTGAV